MNAQACSSPGSLHFDSTRRSAPAPMTAPRADVAGNGGFLDFSGRAVHLEAAAIGLTVAWYFGVTPHRDATILAVGRRAWREGQPDAQTQAHAAALIEQGVSVLLVDMRRSEHAWSGWLGCTRARVIQAATAYLEDRGYDVDSARIVHAC